MLLHILVRNHLCIHWFSSKIHILISQRADSPGMADICVQKSLSVMEGWRMGKVLLKPWGEDKPVFPRSWILPVVEWEPIIKNYDWIATEVEKLWQVGQEMSDEIKIATGKRKQCSLELNWNWVNGERSSGPRIRVRKT